MSKDEVTQLLNEKGFVAENESGVVMVYSSDITFSDLQKIMQEIGYNASFGLKANKKTKGDQNA